MLRVHDDLYRDDVLADPFRYYGALRETDPVHWNADFKTWVVTRYDDVSWVLRHPEFFSSAFYAREERPITPPIDSGDEAVHEYVSAFRATEIIQNDPPTHTRLRAPFRHPFSPKLIREWRQVIRNVVSDLLDAVEARGKMDVIEDLGRPLPLRVISEMLGVPTGDRELVKKQAEERMQSAISLAPDRMRRAADAIREGCEYFDRLLGERAASPRDDLLGVLVKAERAGCYTRAESVSNAQGLLDAGHETTIQLIGNGTLAFMRNRDQWDLFTSSPEALAVTATEECLRYDPPLFALRRIVAADCELRGKHLSEGDRVLWVIASANRDPRAFDDPDVFDIRRQPNRHLSFGGGIHYCLGQYLARLEGQEVFTQLASRFPKLRLETEEVEYAHLRGVRSLKALPVSWN